MQSLRAITRASRWTRHVSHGEYYDVIKCIPRCASAFPWQFRYRSQSTKPKQDTAQCTTSSLFISDSVGQHTALVKVDLDLARRLSDVHLLKDNLHARGLDSIDVDRLVQDFKDMTSLKSRKDQLLLQKKENAKNMRAFMASNENHDRNVEEEKQGFIERGSHIKQELKNLTRKLWKIEEKVMETCLQLPAELLADSSNEEVVMRHNGIDPSQIEACEGHVKLLTDRGLLQISPASPSGYYMFDSLVEREQDLLHDCTQQLLNNDFVPFACLDIFKTLVVEGCGIDFRNPEEIFMIQEKEDLRNRDSIYTWDNTYHLRGASAMSFAAYFARMNISKKNLPLKCYCVGRRYIPVQDLSMKDGLFDAAQGMSIQLFGATESREESMELFEEFCDFVWEFHQEALGSTLPLRLVSVPSGQLGKSEITSSALEVWIPSIGDYRQVASISASGDYVSRRLMMMCSSDEKKTTDSTYLHTVHCTALDIPKVLAAHAEQQRIQGK